MSGHGRAVTTIDNNLPKREIQRRAMEMDQRRQAQIERQIDSINRLLEAQGDHAEKRYENEMLALNNQLADMDVEAKRMVDAVRAIHTRVKSYLNSIVSGKTIKDPRPFLESVRVGLDELLGIEDEVSSDHGSTGETDSTDTSSDREVED